MNRTLLVCIYILLISISFVTAQTQGLPATKKDAAAKTDSKTHPASRDLTKDHTLYVVGYAHLDTQWRWEYPQVIQEYLTKTMRNNFALFEKYPHYIFNFTGANRYMMMKEYYPEDFKRLKQYVAAGRWFPAGSSMEEGDVNSPNAESIIRQILYGNEYFRKEFGKASEEYMLPDCFGFPASLPSILAHAGIKGFSTQKLSSAWQPAPHVGGPDSPEKTPVGIPFNVGIWEGPDGKTVIAALNPLSYGSSVTYDISKTPPTPPAADPALTAQQNAARTRPLEDWVKRIQINGDLTGTYADYHYVGTGDTGGSANEQSIKLMEAIATKGNAKLPPLFTYPGQQPPPVTSGDPVHVGDGPIQVIWSKADQMFLDIGAKNTAKFPHYKGDLELINHSAGSITSEAYQKRWMRKNELLADAAERASVAAAWLGGRTYPQERLNHAWRLVMGGQFHDILPGTATPKAFEFAWNDDVIAMNQFAGVLTSATEAVASAMDTQTKGIAIIVYNSLNIQREDVVEADVPFSGIAPKVVKVIGPDGKEVPSQINSVLDGAAKVLFIANVPSVGYAVYDIQNTTSSIASELNVTESSLENSRYRITIDLDGDVSSIFDKKIGHEVLSAPIRLAIITDNPRNWPAWNMDFEDEQRPPRAFVGGPAKIRVVESGPVRVAVEISREAEDSKFVQTVRLSSGDAGNRVEFNNVIDWKSKEANLKATFQLTASNKNATYNWDIGTIERPNEEERQFEVASHQWIDLTDQSGAYGATILTDCKNASDKPNDNALRLTLLRTPGTRGGYTDQGTQDQGHHEFIFGLAGHGNDWRAAQTDWQAYRLNQPLISFESPKHTGALGKSFSLLKVNNSRIRVLAVKKAEQSDEVIVRMVEVDGKPEKDVHISFAGSVAAAREVNGQEQALGTAVVNKGELVTSFSAYQPRTFAIKLGAATVKLIAPKSSPITLPYDVSVSTVEGRPSEGCFDCSLDNNGTQGKALPAEMMSRDISFADIHFNLAPVVAGKPNAVAAHGQSVQLPPGKYDRIYILAAANGDQKGTFIVGDKSTILTIQDWTGFIGQWDDRIWKTTEETLSPRPGAPADAPPRIRVNPYGEVVSIKPGFIKRADVAWFASHRHAMDGSNEPYAYSYLYVYALDVPEGAKTLTLPDNERIRVLAVSLSQSGPEIRPARPLYDTLDVAIRN